MEQTSSAMVFFSLLGHCGQDIAGSMNLVALLVLGIEELFPENTLSRPWSPSMVHTRKVALFTSTHSIKHR